MIYDLLLETLALALALYTVVIAVMTFTKT